jgi:hypothetical protein
MVAYVVTAMVVDIFLREVCAWCKHLKKIGTIDKM